MKNETIIEVLRAAMGAEPPNIPEIMTAIQAVNIGSPIGIKRAKRALCNALADGRGDTLDPDSRELCWHVIASIADSGGVLPSGDGKLSHIHLRIEASRKSRYVRAAQSGGESLSDWMIRQCDSAS